MPKNVIRGGVVRLGSDLHVITTGRHRPVGIDDVYTTNDGELRVKLKGQASDDIVTTAITPDRELVQMGIRVGCRGGPESVTVVLWDEANGDTVRPDDAMFDGANADVWVLVVVRVQ